MLEQLMDGPAKAIVRAATLRQKLQIKLSASHRVLTTGQPVSALTVERQAPGGVASEVPVFKSLV